MVISGGNRTALFTADSIQTPDGRKLHIELGPIARPLSALNRALVFHGNERLDVTIAASLVLQQP